MSHFSVGLTGGIASGKSTVGKLFGELGAEVIDADQVARDVVEPGTPALDEIREAFGPEVIDTDGTLDRAAMRVRVFNDDAERARLETILHPRIHAELARRSDAAVSSYCVLMIPLLARTSMRDLVDRILVVDCPEPAQIERLIARDDIDRELAEKILAAQESRSDRLKVADDVLENSGRPDDLLEPVNALHEQYLAMAQASE